MKKTLLSPPSNGSYSFQKFLALALLIIGVSFSSSAQVATNYIFSQVDTGNTYTPITGGTVFASGAFTNTAPASVAMGFTFKFNNVSYTNVTVTDNGYLTFGATLPAATLVSPISAATAYEGVVCAYGFNLQAASTNAAYTTPPASEVRYQTIADPLHPGYSIFVLQYVNVSRKLAIGGSQNGLLNFQIRLNEYNNIVETLYDIFNPTTPVAATAGSGQVGLRGTAAADFNNRILTTTNWTATAAGATNAALLNLSNTQFNSTVTKFLWTPCFAPTAITAAMEADNTTVDISWTAPAIPPAGGYDWEIRTSGAAGSGASGLVASGNTASTLVSWNGLALGVSYFIYVKSSCKSTWASATPSPIIPVCNAATIPYTQNFETTTVPGIPACNAVQMVAGAAMVTVDNTSTAYYGFNNKNLITSGNLAQNTWYFTQKINFPAAGSYKLSYKYGGSREQNFFTQKMKVYYGATATAAAMAASTLLADHDQIKLSPLNNVINFTVSTPGVYYIGFNGYAAASQGYLQLDDIVVDYTTCFPPTSLASGQVTSSSAVIAWAPPATSPAGGYQYYVSTSPTAPSNTVIISGQTAAGVSISTLTGLNPLTTYYFWVRSSCGGGDVSEWSVSATFTTTVLLTYCSPSGASFPQDPNGITNVTMGSINNTTGLETNNYGNYSNLTTNVAQLQTVNVNITFQTGFTYDTNIWVDWNNDADFADAGELVYQGTSGSTIPSVLNASFTVPLLNSSSTSTLGAHRLRIGGIDFGPYTDPCRNGNYQSFEDYTIYVTVPPPALTLDSDSNSICSGDITPPVSIISNLNDYQVYTWTPTTGVSGNINDGFTFNPTTTTTYILTATQTSGNFSSNSASYAITVNPLPTPIAITPSALTVCQNATAGIPLTATGGIVSGVLTSVIHEDFNGATNTFTTTNTSFGNTPANAAWTLHPSPYLYNGFTTFVSNDSSQFYMSNSDSQGSGGTTNTELISSTFSLVGFVDASLSFWYHYRAWPSGTATVEISTDGGTTYTVLPNSTLSTISVGNVNAFVNKIINLSAYVGQSNLRIKFKYANASWGWWWAIDNVDVAGSNTPAVYWSPTTGLYNNAALTVPYTGAIQSVVYPRPSVTTTYTATADTPDGCSTYTDITVTVTPINGGTTSGDQTLSCSTNPGNITLTGNVGTVSMWQMCSTSTFASGITNIANTTTTLTAVEIGALTSTRYYRAVVTNGACTAYSTVSAVIVTKTIWQGPFPGSWSNGVPTSASAVEFRFAWPAGSGNVSACSVLVTNSSVVSFGPGETLTVQGEVVVAGGSSLNFDNSASLYQVLDVINSAGAYNGNGGVVANGNQGRINYTRVSTPIRYLDYTYWSTPVYTQTLTGFSPNSPYIGFYQYNNITQAWNWIDPVSVMAPGKGYIIRSPEYYYAIAGTQAWTGVFNGTPNSGTITTPIVGTGSQVNLIGNPYPSTLDANLFLTDPANSSVVGGTMYFWTHNTDMVSGAYAGGDYATYNLSGGAAASTSGPGAIPQRWVSSGTAFFINGIAPGNATFKNSMRVGNNNNIFFKSANNQNQNVSSDSDLERHRYWVDIKNDEGAFKEVLVAYVETATMGLDRLFDGDMIDVGNAITLYTKVDDKKLAIQGRSLPFDAADLVPLAYKTTVPATYTITIREFDGLFTEQHVYLEDTLLNVIHDLTESDYVFATEAGTFESRFVLRYNNGTLGTTQPTFDDSSVIVYRNAAGLHINTGAINMSNVTIYDIRGREIAAQKGVGATQTSFAGLPEAHQVLLVKITGENGKTVTKKVVY